MPTIARSIMMIETVSLKTNSRSYSFYIFAIFKHRVGIAFFKSVSILSGSFLELFRSSLCFHLERFPPCELALTLPFYTLYRSQIVLFCFVFLFFSWQSLYPRLLQ